MSSADITAKIAAPAPSVPPTLAPGVYVQCYRAKLPGATHQARLDGAARVLDGLVLVKCAGVFWHGFTHELVPGVFADYAKLCTDRGMLACASFGLDASVPSVKGARMAAVANMPQCAAIGLDAEGAYDEHGQDAALAIGHAFRAAAPGALVLDQSWPVPTVHAHFPYEQFAGFADAHGRYVELVDLHAEQRYCNDWIRQWGTERYARCEALFNASEAKLDAILPAQARRPHIRTIQGAGWGDIPGDLLTCLRSHATMLVWSEPWPDESFMRTWSALRT